MPGIHKIIDHQIRRWELEAEARRIERERNPAIISQIRPCITLARMLGSGGGAIATRLSEVLRYQILDREILEVLTHEGQFRAQILESLDERDRSSLEMWVEGVLHGSLKSKEDYLRALIHALGPISVHGHAIIIGRGANFILGSERALRVRVVAPLEARVAEVQQAGKISRREAEEQIEKADHERAAFIQHHFKAAVSDPVHYDLTVNAGGLGIEGAVEIINRGLQQKFGGNPAYRI